MIEGITLSEVAQTYLKDIWGYDSIQEMDVISAFCVLENHIEQPKKDGVPMWPLDTEVWYAYATYHRLGKDMTLNEFRAWSKNPAEKIQKETTFQKWLYSDDGNAAFKDLEPQKFAEAAWDASRIALFENISDYYHISVLDSAAPIYSEHQIYLKELSDLLKKYVPGEKI